MSSAVSSFHGYQLLSLLGTSHSGQVYRARDQAHQRIVALKLLAARRCSPAGLARLTELVLRAREAPLARPREVFSVVPDPAQSFLVMRYLPGLSLAETLQRHGPMPWHKVRPLAHRLALALAAGHARGLVHGALKPSNIFLDLDNHTFHLLDHGFWVLPNPAPDHLAPEQLRGDPPTPASDLYALGLLLFETLTGRHPFTGPPDELARQQLQADPPTPSSLVLGLPPRADAILLQLLDKDPRRRPASASALAHLLDARPELDDLATRTWTRPPRPDLRPPSDLTLALPDLSNPQHLAHLCPPQPALDPHATRAFAPLAALPPRPLVAATSFSPLTAAPAALRGPWAPEVGLLAAYLGVLAVASLLTFTCRALP